MSWPLICAFCGRRRSKSSGCYEAECCYPQKGKYDTAWLEGNWPPGHPQVRPRKWYRDYELECMQWLRTAEHWQAMLIAANPCSAPPWVPMCEACGDMMLRLYEAWALDRVFHPERY